jgi:predicted permease
VALRDLRLRLRALFPPGRAERDLHDELAFHIERETKQLIEQGVPPGRARDAARARFGSVTVAADACRDERGTAFVDQTMRDVAYAVRAFIRAPLASVTMVMTVAIGLGLVGVLFTVLNMMLFRVDQVPDVNEMFAVERPRNERDERQLLTRPHFEAMRRETDAFSGMYAELQDVESRIDGRVISGNMVTGNFFQVLGVRAVLGRTLLPSDDEPGERHPVVVLSHRGWTRKLDGDPQVIGRRLTIHGSQHEVIGVMPDGFRGLEVSAPDYWAPLSMLAEHQPLSRGREDSVGVGIVGRLRPGVSTGVARAQLEAWDRQHAGQPAADRRTVAIALLPKRGTVPQPLEAIVLFAPLFFAFGLILLIGCANVANLLLARGVARQKEIGIRLSLGASRGRLVRQLLTESLLMSLTASVLGFFIARGALEAIIAAIMRSLPVDIGDIVLGIPGSDWRVALFLVASAVVATAFFGVMPALQATRLDPVRTLRGEIVRDGRPNRARSLLIGLQVAASALLLICSAIFLRSSLASATVDPGLRTADTIMIGIANEPKREVTVQAVRSDPSVTAAAAIWPEMLGFTRAVTVVSPAARLHAGYRLVSPEYFAILDIPILRGRTFTAAESAGQLPVVILSESLAKTTFPGAEAIGQTIQLEPDLESPTGRTAADDAHRHDRGCVPRCPRFPDLRRTGGRSLPARPCRRRQDHSHRAGARGSGSGTADAPRAADPGRPECGPDHHDANGRPDGNLLPADRILDDADARRAGAVTDGVGALQRAVVPGRAAHEGDRRSHGARRHVEERHPADHRADIAAGGCRTRRRSQPRPGAGHAPAVAADRRPHRRGHSRPRSGGLSRQPAVHHRGMPARRVDSRGACVPCRSDADAQAGLIVNPCATTPPGRCCSRGGRAGSWPACRWR